MVILAAAMKCSKTASTCIWHPQLQKPFFVQSCSQSGTAFASRTRSVHRLTCRGCSECQNKLLIRSARKLPFRFCWKLGWIQHDIPKFWTNSKVLQRHVKYYYSNVNKNYVLANLRSPAGIQHVGWIFSVKSCSKMFFKTNVCWNMFFQKCNQHRAIFFQQRCWNRAA